MTSSTWARYGPSPRSRGSRVAQEVAPAADGSIPAFTGEPGASPSAPMCGRVHPRVHGGAVATGTTPCGARGPSPRSRGSPTSSSSSPLRHGSIPAFTGEPGRMRGCTSAPWVHPRVHGGADGDIGVIPARHGPSPRSRGSRSRSTSCFGRSRSIPAFTGEPVVAGLREHLSAVHPRVHGGAFVLQLNSADGMGPSPRSRGSPFNGRRAQRRIRSIPAFTGEPCWRRTAAAQNAVHPRVHGGAGRALVRGFRRHGPSPRSRGSRVRDERTEQARRSIPAFTGEPRARGRSPTGPRVHPRVHGGAAPVIGMQTGVRGPSPRSRGSRIAPVGERGLVGSIPAFTGEPS